jgi:hypothetical protein
MLAELFSLQSGPVAVDCASCCSSSSPPAPALLLLLLSSRLLAVPLSAKACSTLPSSPSCCSSCQAVSRNRARSSGRRGPLVSLQGTEMIGSIRMVSGLCAAQMVCSKTCPQAQHGSLKPVAVLVVLLHLPLANAGYVWAANVLSSSEWFDPCYLFSAHQSDCHVQWFVCSGTWSTGRLLAKWRLHYTLQPTHFFSSRLNMSLMSETLKRSAPLRWVLLCPALLLWWLALGWGPWLVAAAAP